MSCYLAIDTATEACSAALSLDGKIQERFEVVQREHTQKLLPMIQALLADSGKSFAELDGIACGVGPGSFAGVRIGVGVVKASRWRSICRWLGFRRWPCLRSTQSGCPAPPRSPP